MFLGFMSLTHALIAAAGASLILSSADPMILGLAILGSQLPDLDTSTSLIGQVCFPCLIGLKTDSLIEASLIPYWPQ